METGKWENTNTAILYIVIFFSLVVQCVADDFSNSSIHSEDEVHVGVILDMGSKEGKIVQSCISMAVLNFYHLNSNYTTRLRLHARDSEGKPLQALSAAFDLLDNIKVEAIIGAQTRREAKFLAELGDKAEVPVISLSEPSSYLSSTKYPFFIQSTQDVETCQFKGIASMVNAFEWKDVILIYEDTDFGKDIIPYMVDSFHENGINIAYKSAISDSSTDDNVVKELHKLMEFQTKVFIVHMSEVLVSKLLVNAKELGMISEGYAWFMTATTMNLLDSVVSSEIGAMQGLVGFKSYIPATKDVRDLALRLRRKFSIEDPNTVVRELSAYGIWAYDSTWALAEAVERARDYTRLFSGIKHGSLLVEEILRSRFMGLSGEFQFMSGKLVSNSFEVLNVIRKGETRRVGFWSCTKGYTKEEDRKRHDVSSAYGFEEPIIWPGGSIIGPKGRSMTSRGKMKLRIGVPAHNKFKGFVNLNENSETNRTEFSGFCIDVFMAAIRELPDLVEVDYIPYSGTYNDLIHQVYLGNFDGAVGDITITWERSLYVDFTIPHTNTGAIAMVVPNKSSKTNMWIFLRPLAADLWMTTTGFFILTGFVVWIIERPINQEFQGSLSQQIGTMLWFTFSTLVFAHREKLLNNLSKFVVIVWVFTVLILTSSYTATLTSMMTVQEIQLNPKGSYLGYQMDSPIQASIFRLNFEGFKPYGSLEEYAEALSKGSKHGGVSAIVDEVPYINKFVAKYPGDYTIKTMPMSNIHGFGFAFQKGSSLVQGISKTISELREAGALAVLQRKWSDSLGVSEEALSTPSDDSADDPHSLSLVCFSGLFLISGVSLILALLVFFSCAIKEKMDFLNCKILQLIAPLQRLRMHLCKRISDGSINSIA